MKKILLLAMISVATLFISGCASGPKYSEMKSTISPLGQNSGRIYFYRTAVMGAAVQPAVKLNNEEVGTAKPKGVFFVDRAPGNYVVETSTEVSRRLSFVLESGTTRYVRLNMAMGFFVGHVYPELVENSVGEAEIQKCSFSGSK